MLNDFARYQHCFEELLAHSLHCSEEPASSMVSESSAAVLALTAGKVELLVVDEFG